jgi:biotin carboxyl carrier protein
MTMNTFVKLVVVAVGMAAFFLFDLASLGVIPEAEAVLGVRRRTARRTAVVVGGTASAEVAAANANAAASQQQAAEANAEAAAAQQQAAAAQQQAAAPAPAPTPMITTLPAGCVNTGQVYQCGSVYYKPYLQGTTVVYAQVPGP